MARRCYPRIIMRPDLGLCDHKHSLLHRTTMAKEKKKNGRDAFQSLSTKATMTCRGRWKNGRWILLACMNQNLSTSWPMRMKSTWGNWGGTRHRDDARYFAEGQKDKQEAKMDGSVAFRVDPQDVDEDFGWYRWFGPRERRGYYYPRAHREPSKEKWRSVPANRWSHLSCLKTLKDHKLPIEIASGEQHVDLLAVVHLVDRIVNSRIAQRGPRLCSWKTEWVTMMMIVVVPHPLENMVERHATPPGHQKQGQ